MGDRKKEQHVCKTCKFAEWELTKIGRPNPRRHGRCTWPMPDFLDFPFMVEVRAHKKSIWHDYDTECPAWEVKPA